MINPRRKHNFRSHLVAQGDYTPLLLAVILSNTECIVLYSYTKITITPSFFIKQTQAIPHRLASYTKDFHTTTTTSQTAAQ